MFVCIHAFVFIYFCTFTCILTLPLLCALYQLIYFSLYILYLYVHINDDLFFIYMYILTLPAFSLYLLYIYINFCLLTFSLLQYLISNKAQCTPSCENDPRRFLNR